MKRSIVRSPLLFYRVAIAKHGKGLKIKRILVCKAPDFPPVLLYN
jgi:hypothetical protein